MFQPPNFVLFALHFLFLIDFDANGRMVSLPCPNHLRATWLSCAARRNGNETQCRTHFPLCAPIAVSRARPVPSEVLPEPPWSLPGASLAPPWSLPGASLAPLWSLPGA